MADAGVPDKNEPYTPDSLAQAVKKQAMKEAVDALAGAGGYIPKADEIIKDEVDSAVKEITTVMEEWGVTGEDGVAPNEAIYKHANYAGNGEGDGGQAVTARHYKLIDELKQAEHQPELNAAGIKLEEVRYPVRYHNRRRLLCRVACSRCVYCNCSVIWQTA